MRDIRDAQQFLHDNEELFVNEEKIYNLLNNVLSELEVRRSEKQDPDIDWQPIDDVELQHAERELILSEELNLSKGSNHYKSCIMEPIEIIGLIGGLTKFCIYNIIKYTLRCPNHRDPLDSVQKIRVYTEWYGQVIKKVIELRKERKAWEAANADAISL